MKIIYLCSAFLILFFIGCNNWIENPKRLSESTEKDSVQILKKYPYPEKTNKIYFSSDGALLVGSSDGKFYKSMDDGNTWQKTGEMISLGEVNCFLECEESVTKKKYVFAGTENGIYISENGGSSWREALTTSNSDEKVKVYFFETTSNILLKKDTVIAYGWDGTNNKFKLCLGESNWSREVLSSTIPYKMTSRSVFISPINPLAPDIGVYTNYLYGCSNGTEFYSYRIENPSNSNVFRITSLRKYTAAGVIYSSLYASDKLFYATNKGIIIVDGFTENLIQKSMEGFDVRTLLIKDDIMIAGTDLGLFYSSDNAVSWQTMYISTKTENIKEVFLYKNKLFIIKNDGEVLIGSFYKYDNESLFSPVLIEPKDNSEIQNSNITFSWKKIEKNANSIFALQISPSPDFKQDETTSIENIDKQFCLVPQLKANSQYYWRIITYNFYKTNNSMPAFSFRTKQ
jgi:hypothetical protein